MKKLLTLLLIISFFNLGELSAKPGLSKLELRIDNLKDQVNSLEVLIENYESNQDEALLKVIFREQKILLNKLLKNYSKFKSISKVKVRLHLQETRKLLHKAKVNYLATIKLTNQGSIMGFDVSPSYRDVYDSLKTDLELLNRAVDEIEFADLIASGGSGVYGRVSLITGDCIPNVSKTSCDSSFVAREVLVHKAMLYQDLNSENETELVLSLNSNEDGSFFAALEPGLYSVLAVEDGEKYCHTVDGDGYTCLVEVTETAQVEFDIKIDKAVH